MVMYAKRKMTTALGRMISSEKQFIRKLIFSILFPFVHSSVRLFIRLSVSLSLCSSLCPFVRLHYVQKTKDAAIIPWTPNIYTDSEPPIRWGDGGGPGGPKGGVCFNVSDP